MAGSIREPTAACIHHVFEAQAAARPNAVALTDAAGRLSYGALNARANQLARALRRAGVGRGTLVGLCLDRRAELVVGILGILKAGGAYVPLDLDSPPGRLAFILADAGVSIVVTRTELAAGLGLQGVRTIDVDAESAAIAPEDEGNADGGAGADDPAYAIYTSGSTGTPKGVLIAHRNVVRLFTSTDSWFGFTADDVWTLFHSSAFDFSVWEIWGALLFGGRLVVVPFDTTRSPRDFYLLLCAEGVTVLNQTPSAFRQLIRAEESAERRDDLALRYVVLGGEALDMKSLQPWFDRHGDERPRLVNMYGITETTVHVTYRPLTAADVAKPSVIGRPIPDLTIELLDAALQPVPPGQPGEICVGGAGVGAGYLRRPELTDEKFIRWPTGAARAARLYRSGDLARRLPDGDLEYLGRMDQQVKIRGFRVEPGEIESVLNEHPSVRESVVLARDDARGGSRLVAYLIPRAGAEIDAGALRQMLRSRVPEYMVPAVFVAIDELPLTINGKLDVTRLPNASADTGVGPGTSGTDIKPRSDLEDRIAAVCQDVLARSAVGRDESFFDIGADSILLAEMHGRMQAFAGEFPIASMFEHPTVGLLAAHLERGAGRAGGDQSIRDRGRRRREALAQRAGRRA